MNRHESIILAAMGIGLFGTHTAWGAVGTAFTYQGSLEFNGQAVSDTCDFDFSLWDAASGGTQQGSTLTLTLPVDNGLFTTPLDFGVGMFEGDARWLETAVCCPSGCAPGGLITLNPRQELTPAPYTLFSDNTRGITVDGSGNVGFGTPPLMSLTLPKKNGDRITLWGPSPPTDHHYGFGIASETLQIITPDTQTRTAIGCGSSTDFTETMSVRCNGKVGIGTINPVSKLHVVGDIAVTGTVDGVDLSLHALDANAHHTPPTSLPPSGAAGGDLTGTYPNPSVGNDSHTHADSTISDMITVNNGRLFAPIGVGNVGINNTNPSYPLDVFGTLNATDLRVGGQPVFPLGKEIAYPVDIHAAFIRDSSVFVNHYNNGVSAVHNSTDETWYFHLPIPVADTTDGRQFVLTKVRIHRESGGQWWNRWIREIQSDGTLVSAASSSGSYTGTITWDFPDVVCDEQSRYALELVTTRTVGVESQRIYGITIYGYWQ